MPTNHIQSKQLQLRTLFLSTAGALLVLVGAFVISSNFILGDNSAHATSGNTKTSLELASVIDMSIPTSVTLNCTPGFTGATSNLCTSIASVSVATNNLTGYTLYMNTTNGSPTALTNTATSPASTIPTLTQSYTSSNFPANYWGYTGGLDKSSESGGYNCASNYCPVLAYESTDSNYAPNRTIKETSAPSTSSTTNITFAGKVDTTKPSGTYSTSVTFTAVANYVPPTKLVDGLAMQEVTSSICANSDTDQTYTLVDTRGGGTNYTVAKLQDGNCWMTQNLALGGSTAMNLTQVDSNVGPSGFELPASVSEGSWAGFITNAEFFDYAGNYPSQQATTKYGNFYNWPAATAGSGGSTSGVDAPYDICPKNWRLPSASSTGATDSEFYTMLNHYINTGSWSNTYWSGVTTSQFTSTPVSLVFSGLYYGGLYYQGSGGGWWSSTAGDSYYAFDLYAYSFGSVYPRSSDNKGGGDSVRCLVEGS